MLIKPLFQISARGRIRSPPSTRRCYRASRRASCWPTIRAPARTSWRRLLIKELIARGDLERCLFVCPGSLAERWQDELYCRFQLSFEILNNDKLEAAGTRNWFLDAEYCAGTPANPTGRADADAGRVGAIRPVAEEERQARTGSIRRIRTRRSRRSPR